MMASMNLVAAIIVTQVAVIFGSNCDWRYFQHYEQKNCEAVLGSDGCPVRFNCSPLSEDDLETCVSNGKFYPKEKIRNVGTCNSCRCQPSSRGSSIECAAVDCADWDTKNKSCYMGYLPDECCPIEICPGSNAENQKACTYNGRDYRIGEFIDVKDPCTSCICTDKWKGDSGYGCKKVNCLLGIYASQIRSGCLPVYSEARCCPLTVDCSDLHGVTPVDDVEGDEGNHCQYKGKYYARGSFAHLASDKHQCAICQCKTPPDFTCVRKSCPPKPRDDCVAQYGHCCPQYKCPYNAK